MRRWPPTACSSAPASSGSSAPGSTTTCRSPAGRSGEALPYARQAVQMAPFSPPALDVYAAVTADLGNCQQSVLASRRALDVLPDEATAESRQSLQARLDEHVARCVPSGR